MNSPTCSILKNGLKFLSKYSRSVLALDVDEAHNSTGSVVIISLVIPKPMHRTKMRPPRRISQG